MTYDEIGRVKTQTGATGLTVGYEYNNLDAVTKVSYPDGTSEETEYLCCGIPGVVKDRAGRRWYYDYDVLKRVVRVQDAAGQSLQLGYDKNGNRTSLLDGKKNLTRWAYDGLDRVVEKAYPDGTTGGSAYAQGVLSQTRGARGQVVSYGYDDNGNLSGIDYPLMADVSMLYNALDQVTSVVDGVGAHGFTYSGTGRLLGLDGPLTADEQSFAYDAQGRLQR